MDCPEARDWLLLSEAPADPADVPPAVAAHVRACPACGDLGRALDRIERQWRDQPVPSLADAGRAAFLARLAAQPAPSPVRRRFAAPRWALVAAVLLALGTVAWLIVPSEARASADLIDRLIDWNLDLAAADAGPGRAELAGRAAALQSDLGRAALSPADRELAERLLETGSWLAANDDPVGVAERFDAVADQLLDRIQAATAAGEKKRADRLARQYRRVLERGIDPSVRRVLASPALNFEHQRRIERVLLSDAGRLDALAALLEKAPDASRKEIRRALELSKKRPKPPKRDRSALTNPPAAR